MSAGLLRCTAYFGERQRTGHRFTADALLERYSAASVTTGVVIRGIAGFGPRHQLRSDVTLSGSEDPPVAVIAVDAADTMRRLASDAAGMVSRGLVTLESTRSADAPVPAGSSVTLTAYLHRGQRISGVPAHVAVGELLRRHGFYAAVAYLGVDGMTGGRRQRAVFFGRNVEVPAMVVATGPSGRAADAIGALRAVPALHMLTVEDVIGCNRDGRRGPAPPADVLQKLTVQTCATALHDGVPVHRALLSRLRDLHPTAGVTALRGVWGFQGDGAPLTDSVLRVARRIPVTTIAVDTAERIAVSLRVAEALSGPHGVITVSPVLGAVSLDR